MTCEICKLDYDAGDIQTDRLVAGLLRLPTISSNTTCCRFCYRQHTAKAFRWLAVAVAFVIAVFRLVEGDYLVPPIVVAIAGFWWWLTGYPIRNAIAERKQFGRPTENSP